MSRPGSLRKCGAAFVAVALLGSSAASAAPRTVDPLVALSVFGTASSRAAVCAAGSQAAAAAGAAVAAQAGAQPGCVLPVVDAPPPPVVTQTAPTPVLPAEPIAAPAFGVLPLLLGLAAIAGAAALLLAGDKGADDNINIPVSP